MEANETILETQRDSRKSFYGKAVLVKEGDVTKLRSYSTIVAEFNHKTNKVKINGWYSSTTARHINEFLNYFGFDKMTKQQMEAE